MSPGSRGYLLTVAGLAAGGLLCVVLAGTTVATLDVDGPLASSQVTVAASNLVPFARAAGFIALAAVVALYATGRIGRRVIGLVLIAVGAPAFVTVVVHALDLTEAAGRWARDASDVDGTVADVTTTPWPMVGLAAGGALIVIAGAMAIVRGAGWPTMGRRYDRPAARADAAGRPGGRDGATGARDTWDALDRGEDPTA